MLRVCLVCAGDVDFHYLKLLGMQREEFSKEVEGIANALAGEGVELVFLPDRGAAFEVAKKFKEAGGGKVYGTVPFSDKDFGIKHLEPFMNAEVNGRRVVDEFIDTGNWYKQDMTLGIFGDVILMLGLTLGSLGEVVNAFYLYKLFAGFKPEVSAIREKVHPMVRAGSRVPFSLIVYKPFVRGEIPFEIVKHIERVNGRIYFVENPEELRKVLRELEESEVL